MIVVHTEIPFDPASVARRDRLLDDLVAQARAESGTHTYRVSRAHEDDCVVRFFEIYEDREAHETHTGSDAYRAFVRALPEITTGEMETVRCETSEVTRATFTGSEAAASVE